MSTVTCEQTDLDILAYLTEDLDAAEAAKVRDHLERCPGCAAEAAELRAVSQHLHARLKEIPAVLAVPALVSARIERALQAERKQAKRRPFWPGLGVAVAAAAAFFISLGLSPGFAERVEGIPGVGLVAAPFLRPDVELQLATLPPSAAGSVGSAQRTEPNTAVTANGVTVVVTRVEQKANYTKILYRAQGAKLLPGVDLQAYLPMITVQRATQNNPKLYRLTADQRGDDVLFEATFSAEPTAQSVMLTALPLEGLPDQQQPWTISLQ